MKVKDIQNIILSYDMDYDTIIEYSKEDLATTLEGLNSSLETAIDNNNTYLINDILEYYIDIFDTIESIDDLDIYINKIKKIISSLYKTKDITNDNQEFKEDIFLANVDNFDKKTGILGKKKYYRKPIYPYPSSKNDINKLIKTFNHTEDIIQKFSERSKTLNNENYD